jgi:hypothetical protein
MPSYGGGVKSRSDGYHNWPVNYGAFPLRERLPPNDSVLNPFVQTGR